MTAIAGKIGVTAIQRKTCGEMVKFFSRDRGLHKGHARQQKKSKQQGKPRNPG
jgi:hypothetical protein